MTLKPPAGYTHMTSICCSEHVIGFKHRIRRATRNDRKLTAWLFPSGLQALVDQMSAFVGDEGSLLANNTLLPLFSRFLPSQDVELLARHSLCASVTGLPAIVGLNGPRSGWCPRVVASCPECARIDVAPCGRPFWRRDHLVPGLLFCGRHGVPLETLCPTCHGPNARPSLITHPGAQCDCEPNVLPGAKRFSQEARNAEVELARRVSLLLDATYGMPHGQAYRPFLKAQTPRQSTRSTFCGLKLRRRFEALSESEKKVLFTLGFHPYVVDVRDQYCIYDSKQFHAARTAGNRMLRSSTMTIDVVVTYILPGDPRLRYHGISVKHPDYVADEADKRRELREQNELAKRGWTWELLRGDAVSGIRYANSFVMYRAVRETDVYSRYEESQWFADILKRSSRRGTMGAVLKRISSRVGISEDDAHRLFAVAACFGFLMVDHRMPLLADAPLHLID